MENNMQNVFPRVFMWMFIGLGLTFGTAYYVSTQENMIYNLFSGGTYWILILVQIGVVFFLGARIRKMSTMTATTLFLLYSTLTGLTFSTLFLVYEMESIMWVFAMSAGVFLLFGLFGYFTKIDLSKIGSILFMFLIGLVVMLIANMFIKSETFDFALCLVGLFLFLVFVAYDIHMIKKNFYGIEDEDKLAIYGALQLYLDFINIFIRLLQLFGKRR